MQEGSERNPPAFHSFLKGNKMSQLTKQELLEEAKKQSEALERIGRWRTYAMVLSAIGVAVAYMGFTGNQHRIAIGVTGIVLIVIGVAFAVICNLGIRTGRDNVEKILNAAEKGQNDSDLNKE